MEKQNDFIKLRETVNNIVYRYNELRKRIDWKDPGKSATINRLAKPFQTGYFTIAIAGKMSSGKSTFINSLIGENLLPTGMFQTTSGITWIVSSDKRYMEVTYADGKTKTFTENLASELQNLVAVPEEYPSLPINHINNLIKGDSNIETILKQKPAIEEMTHLSSDDRLWEKYVASTPKSKIADKVMIYLPLPAEYEGWRIVDTPGIGAIGGIQDATKKLITSNEGENNTVDAVILLQNGAEGVEDESAITFAEEVKKSMGKLAEGRLFFVLTHAGDKKFVNNKDGILARAYSNFGTKLDIPNERIEYVDSFINHFLVDAKKSQKDYSDRKSLQTPLKGWNEKDWNILKRVICQFYYDLEDKGKEVNNNSLFSELESVSRFDSLRERLYDFLNKEKANAFNKLLTLINGDLKNYQMSLSEDIKSASNGLQAFNNQIKETNEEKRNLDIALSKAQQSASSGTIEEKFEFIEYKLQELSKLSSIDEVRTAYLEIIQEGLSKQKFFFESLKTEFSHHIGTFKMNETSVMFDSLDLDDLERRANDKATQEVTDYSRCEEELVVTKRFWSDDKEYVKIYPYTKKETDFEQKRREFTALVVKEGRKHCKAFKAGIKSKTEHFFNIVYKDIEDKTTATICRLERYKNRMDDKNALLKELHGKLSEVEIGLKELKEMED